MTANGARDRHVRRDVGLVIAGIAIGLGIGQLISVIIRGQGLAGGGTALVIGLLLLAGAWRAKR